MRNEGGEMRDREEGGVRGERGETREDGGREESCGVVRKER